MYSGNCSATHCTNIRPHPSKMSVFSSCDAAARRESSHSWGFLTTHDALQSVGLLWTNDRPIAETSIWQHTTIKTNIHVSGGIRTRNPESAIDGATTGTGTVDNVIVCNWVSEQDVSTILRVRYVTFPRNVWIYASRQLIIKSQKMRFIFVLM